MRKLLTTAGIGAMAFLLSSCFTLQSLSLKAGALKPGGSTKLTLNLRPFSGVKSAQSNLNQFVLVGNNTSADIGVGSATWGTNSKFGGPQPMVVNPLVATSIGTQCDVVSGFTFSDISSSLTWKSFITLNKVKDAQKVGQFATVSVGIKAKAGATHHNTDELVVVTGAWQDNPSAGTVGVVDSQDTFWCSGNAMTSLYII